MLMIEPMGGLCNRLRTIDSAVALGQDIELPVHVLWHINTRVGSSFSGLFQMPQEFYRLEEFTEAYLKQKWVSICRALDVRRPRSYCLRRDIKKLLDQDFDFRQFSRRKRLHFKTQDRFFRPYGIKRLFRPLPAIQQVIDSRCSGFENCVGVHVRRADHRISMKYSPTSMFLDRMKNELQQTDCNMFFVATDDESVEELLQRTFGDRVIIHPKTNRSRDNSQAMEDAVIDLFCLSRTNRIIGSAFSSFTQIAAEIEGIPMEYAAGDLPDASEFGWHDNPNLAGVKKWPEGLSVSTDP
jgi:hypothetical protein